MIKILSLLLLVSISAFADNYVDEFPIFVYGDVQSIENAFKFIRLMLLDSDFVSDIVTMIAMLVMIFAGWKIFKTKSLMSVPASGLYLITGILALTGAMNVSVHIEDQRQQIDFAKYGGVNYAKVDDIPYPIAAIISVASTISKTLQDKVEDATTDIDSKDVSYQSIGFAKAYSDASKIINYANFKFDENTTQFERATTAYLNSCVLKYGIEHNQNIGQVVKNPEEDIFKAIKPETLGIEGSIYTIDFDNNTTTCKDLYDTQIAAKYGQVADELYTRLKKVTEGNLDNTYDGLSNVTDMKIENSYLSGKFGQFQAYYMNVAALGPVQQAIRNMGAGTDVTSGQDLANAITLNATKAKMQNEGIGQFRWMAEILPFGFHYFLGVIYAISVFVMIVAVAMGYEKGMALIMNYAQGLLSFEFIRVALIYANNSVNQYSKYHAADVLSAIGSNPASITALPHHYEYLATMTGVAGILGIAAVFMIPGMIFTGKVAMAAGAIGGLAGRYKGNDFETAQMETAKQRAAQETYDRAIMDDMRLQKMGMNTGTVPANMGASEYYAQLNNDLSQMSKSWAAHAMGGEKLESAAHGTKMQTMSSIETSAYIGNHTNAGQNIQSGQTVGAMQVGNIEANAEMSDISARIQDGTRVQSLQKLASTATMSNLTDKEAMKTGSYMGEQSLAKSNAMLKHMSESNFREDLQDLENASVDSLMGKANGIRENKDRYGDDVYKENSEWGETSQAAQTQGSRNHYNGNVNAMQNVVETDSNLKAAEQEKILNSKLNTANSGTSVESAAKDIAEAIKKIATTDGNLAAEKLNSSMVDLNTKKTGKYLNNDGTLTKSAESAMAIDTLSKISPMLNRADIFGSKDGRKNAVEAMAKSTGAKSQKEIDEWANKNGFSNHANMSASDFAKELFSKQGTVFSSHAQIADADGNMISLAFSKKGAMAQAKSGTSSVNDNSHVHKDGLKFDGQNRETAFNLTKDTAMFFGASEATATEYAENIIQGWDRYKESVVGASVVAAGAGYVYKKGKMKHHLSATDDPNLKAAHTDGTNNTKNTTHPNVSGDMESSLQSDLTNYNKNISDTQVALQDELKNAQNIESKRSLSANKVENLSDKLSSLSDERKALERNPTKGSESMLRMSELDKQIKTTQTSLDAEKINLSNYDDALATSRGNITTHMTALEDLDAGRSGLLKTAAEKGMDIGGKVLKGVGKAVPFANAAIQLVQAEQAIEKGDYAMAAANIADIGTMGLSEAVLDSKRIKEEARRGRTETYVGGNTIDAISAGWDRTVDSVRGMFGFGDSNISAPASNAIVATPQQTNAGYFAAHTLVQYQTAAQNDPGLYQASVQHLATQNNQMLQHADSKFTMHAQTPGGMIPIGRNRSGNLAINGMGTQVPYSDFQHAMQNDMMRNQFSSALSNGIFDNNGGQFGSQSMPSLIQDMSNKFNNQEFMTQRQTQNMNTLTSYTDELVSNNEEMFSSVTDLNDQLTELKKSIDFK